MPIISQSKLHSFGASQSWTLAHIKMPVPGSGVIKILSLIYILERMSSFKLTQLNSRAYLVSGPLLGLMGDEKWEDIVLAFKGLLSRPRALSWEEALQKRWECAGERRRRMREVEGGTRPPRRHLQLCDARPMGLIASLPIGSIMSWRKNNAIKDIIGSMIK